MIMEEIYGGLTGGESVHLQNWPDLNELPEDPELVSRMDQIREAASMALRLREDAGLRVRLPLSSVTIAGKEASKLTDVVQLLAEEINVHEVILTEDIGELATLSLRPNGNLLGPRLGGEVQKVFAAAKLGKWSLVPGEQIEIAGQILSPEEYEIALEPSDPVNTASLRSNESVVVLDMEITPALEAEGAARDLIRTIQQARKEADLDVTDRIEVEIKWSPSDPEGVKVHEEVIMSAVLARRILWLPGDAQPAVKLITL